MHINRFSEFNNKTNETFDDYFVSKNPDCKKFDDFDERIRYMIDNDIDHYIDFTFDEKKKIMFFFGNHDYKFGHRYSTTIKRKIGFGLDSRSNVYFRIDIIKNASSYNRDNVIYNVNIMKIYNDENDVKRYDRVYYVCKDLESVFYICKKYKTGDLSELL
jgi:hypothetical protein